MIDVLSPDDCEAILEFADKNPIRIGGLLMSELNIMTLRNMLFYNTLIIVGNKQSDGSINKLMIVSVPSLETEYKSLTLVYHWNDVDFTICALNLLRGLVGDNYSKVKVNIYDMSVPKTLIESGFVSEFDYTFENGSIAVYSYFFQT